MKKGNRFISVLIEVLLKVIRVFDISAKPVRVTFVTLLLGWLLALGDRSAFVGLGLVACIMALVMAFAGWLDLDYTGLVKFMDQMDMVLNGVVEFTCGWKYPMYLWALVVLVTREYSHGSLYWLWAPLAAIVGWLAIYFISLCTAAGLEEKSAENYSSEAYEGSSYA